MHPLLSPLVGAVLVALSAAVDITVQTSAAGNATGAFGHPFGYGFLHEDINYSGDGGIYAELIRNRAFQFSTEYPVYLSNGGFFPINASYPVSLDSYAPINGAALSIQFLSQPLSEQLPASMRVGSNSTSGTIGFTNDGYFGMDVKQQTYQGSFWVRGAYNGSFTASLQSNLTTDVFGSVQVPSKAVADDWVEHTFELVPTKDAPSSNNTFAVTFNAAGADSGYLDFNLISLFPPTFKGRKNGLRVDLAEALYDMNPTFLRFPGGNMLEGASNKTPWDWKNTIGPLRYRPGFEGVWGYQQTNGLGLMEYFQWAEDMNMQSILGIYVGYSLNGDITPQEDMQPLVDDALNQLEFVLGPVNSTWGARRAAYGHPEPFELNYVEVGNEEFSYGYESYRLYRFQLFENAISKAYPHIQVVAAVSSSDPTPATSSTGPNLVDGFVFPNGVIGDWHPYGTPDEFLPLYSRFDNDNVGHMVGEMAAALPNGGSGFAGGLRLFPWWIGSIGEAVSLLGFERNADRMRNALYAPVIRNTNSYVWPTTLIENDASTVTKSTSWYVWSLFAHHPLSHTLPVATADNSLFYHVAGKDVARDGALVWKGAVYNTTNHAAVPISVQFQSSRAGDRAAFTLVTNPGGDPYAINEPYGPIVVDVNTTILTADSSGSFAFSMPELSVAVLDTDLSITSIGN